MSNTSGKLKEQNGVSRRSFLKGAAVVAAAAGGIVPEPRITKAASPAITKTTHLSVDICVIGAAGAGLTAAGSAIDAGVKNIIVLEKMEKPGGTGAQGMFGVESPVQKRLGIHHTADECFKYHMDMHNWYCNAKLVRNWMTSIGDVIEWLEKRGVEFSKVDSFLHDRLFKTHHYAKTGAVGKAVMNAMLPILKENGVEVRTNTRATKLLTNSNGDVIGVLATSGNEELRISAKAVIIGTGSISSNDELKARFYPGEDLSHVTIMANQGFPTGDGLIMAEEIGAASTHISTLFIGPHGHNTNEQVGALMRRPQLPKVNRLGYRFANEDLGVTSNFGWMFCLSVDRQPDKVCYSLMDTSILKEFQRTKEVYSKFDQTGPRRSANMMQELTKKKEQASSESTESEELIAQFEKKRADWVDTVVEDIYAEVKEGRAIVADTWDEIARYIGCDPATLKDTIMQYNTFCLNKYDGEFLKMSEYLWPLINPPYYALQGYSGIDTCIGGLRTNHNLEVVNKKEAPIKGLYAAGVCVGNWLGVGYAFYGSEFSFTQYSGYAAGKNAAKYVISKV